MAKKQLVEIDPEIAAIGAVYKALKGLPSGAHARVLSYVAAKLNIEITMGQPNEGDRREATEDISGASARPTVAGAPAAISPRVAAAAVDELEGISPVAQKWIVRNGLQAQGLTKLFSLGVDEIDLIAKAMPGKSKRDRMHSVLLLKGIAAYLGTGAPRFTFEELKEACLHYQAYDLPNFAKHLREFPADASGDKSTGYTLTPRGLTSATELIKEFLSSKTKD